MKRLKNYFRSLPFKTQSNIRVGLFIAIILALSYILTSCAVNPLMKPDNGHMITWKSSEYYYFGTYAEPKKDSIPIQEIDDELLRYHPSGEEFLCVGDIVYFTNIMGD